VGVLILHEHNILLVKRAQEPAKGEWSVPGGLVELGETIHQAAHREVWEECSIRVDIVKQLDVFEFIENDDNNAVKFHYIVLDYLATYKSGDVSAQSDIEDARWFNSTELDNLNCSKSIKKLAYAAFESVQGDL
jgi:ADP-ribose pyrophosphatase